MKTPISARRVISASVLLWLLALGFVAAVAAALPAQAPTAFWMLLRAHDVTGALAGLAVLALAAPLSRLFGRLDWTRIADFIARYLWPLCALSCAFYAALSFWAYHHYPLAMDEYCPLTQSRIFLAGQSKGWVPPELLEWIMAFGHRGEFFSVANSSGYYMPVYWPGLAILLTPFTALGVPWLCNPVLGALALAGVHRLTLRVGGSREAAAWAWVLTLCSPVIAINAASFYAMPAHLLFNVVYTLLLLRDDRRGAFAAGIIGGFALILHNPAPHLAFSLPWLGFIVWKRRRLLAPLLLGYFIFALPIGLGWSAFLREFDASHYAQAARATGASSPFVEMLSRFAAVVKLPAPLMLLARAAGFAKTVIWAVPGLLVVAWLGWRGAARQATHSRALRLLSASLFSTFALYFLVQLDQGHGWGYRYLHSAWFVLAVAGGVYLARSPAKPYFAALCALSLLVLLPLRAAQVESYIARHLAQVPTPQSPVSVTFIDGAQGSFTVDLAHNDPFLRNNDWRLISRGAARNEALARKYLIEPQREQSGEWGEIWSGRALRHPTK